MLVREKHYYIFYIYNYNSILLSDIIMIHRVYVILTPTTEETYILFSDAPPSICIKEEYCVPFYEVSLAV